MSPESINDQGILGSVSSIRQIVRIIRSLSADRRPVVFGVQKRDGVSIARERRTANDAAVKLLDSLPENAALTDEQRAILAGYTGEGGIGGSEYEYYTPQYVAEGMWDLIAAYGVKGGLGLEPSAATGVFQETKPKGVVMQAAELSNVSGRINRLLHPEDNVSIAPFEQLARVTPDNTFDHCIGNVPFGASRGGFGELDPAYKNESLAGYFILRPIDKVRPGGLITLIVPHGITSNSSDKKLRERVSRKAEFLGAHRLPSGTFANNGTATVVDVWVLRKHTEELKELVDSTGDSVLKEANVLWDTFITGKWFDREGRRFIHGEMSVEGKDKFARLVVKSGDGVSPASVKEALARRFDSRIKWDLIALQEPGPVTTKEGDKRLIDGTWHEFVAGRWLIDDGANHDALDVATFGAESYSGLKAKLSTSEGILSLEIAQLERVADKFPEAIPAEYRSTIAFSLRQKPAMRERIMRGSVIGARIRVIQDKIATGIAGETLDLELADLQKQISAEIALSGSPHAGKAAELKGDGAANWLKYKASVTKDGQLTALVTGTLEAGTAKAFDATDHEQVLRHLFSQVDLDPVELTAFRKYFEGELPESDSELFNLLAQKDGIAVQPDGTLIPMDRATSGDIGSLNSALMGALASTPDGVVKDNYHRQLAEISKRRKWTPADDIDFSLNSRWFDRRLITEFLHEQGFSDLKYIKNVETENGMLTSAGDYAGRDGVFTGYRYKTVQQRDKETKKSTFVYKRVRNNDAFLDQFENYLNGIKPRGPNANVYLDRISRMEKDFNAWVRQHDELDNAVRDYNDAFNAYIPFAHSEESLNLTGVSGKREPFSYQNAEVRRLSEDGRGILGFDTGLGKTTTALALEAYNFENGRSKRTAIVVPKAVYQNWYYEAQDFYSQNALSSMLFVGLDEVRGEDGKIKQVAVLNEKGDPVLNSVSGQPVMRNAVVTSSADTIKERMNMIPMSNYRTVIMTKEQFAAIPLRAETVQEHAREVLFAEAEAGRVDLSGNRHSDAAKKNRILDKASDTGSDKKEEYPYFEDMHFDSVIADEAHNYRNSYATGRESSQLAYLPNSVVAKSARDMALKSSYLMKKFNGRGPVMLTATPLVNSPVDAFNMLSHVVSTEEWQRMGIFTPDDFVKVFGLTELVSVTKISGEVEQKLGLVGFKNLDGLRGIFHRWTDIKTVDDVSGVVKVPPIIENNVSVPMNDTQAEIYESLRKRADKLSQGKGDDDEEDSIFSIIRDMDRVCIDPDLYLRQMTFRFPASKQKAVESLISELPVQVRSSGDGDDDSTETVTVNVTAKMAVTADYVEICVPEAAEQDVIKRLTKFGLTEKDVHHPIPPKYSALIENLKTYMPDGKQIIFTDEKTQHEKLRRILASALDIDPAQIGILNASTVASASKKAPKIKAVKPPKELKEDASDEDIRAYYAQKESYDAYVAQLSENSLQGMEAIAADYNEGRTPLLICNKKAEVGINLHHGTSDIHHLTLPWTPASIKQRNGRGARVGSKAASVRAHYYCGKGSFDEFRVETLSRKKDRLKEILTSGEARMANGDANSQEDMNLLLAADPEDYARRVQASKDKAEAQAKEAAQKRARLDLLELVKMQHALKYPVETLQRSLTESQERLPLLQASAEEVRAEIQQAIEKEQPWFEKTARERSQLIDAQLAGTQKKIRMLDRQLLRAKKAEQRIRQIRPEIESAISAGLLDVEPDILTHGDRYALLPDARTLKKNAVYQSASSKGVYLRIKSFDLDAGEAIVTEAFSNAGGYVSPLERAVGFSEIGEISDVPESEAVLREWAASGVQIGDVATRISKSAFTDYLKKNWLILHDAYVVYRNVDGNLDSHRLRSSPGGYDPRANTWLASNADSIVYPDAEDPLLKKAAAKWYRSSVTAKQAAGFFRALFGMNFVQETERYGEIAQQSVINEIVASYVTEKLSEYDSEGRSFDGKGRSQYSEYLLTGSYDAEKFISRHINTEAISFIPGEYLNRADFTATLKDVYRAKIREHLDAVAATAKSVAHKYWLNYQDMLKLPPQETIQRLENMGSSQVKLSDAYITYTSIRNDYDSRHFDRFFADAVNMGLLNEQFVTESQFSDANLLSDTVDRINKNFAEYGNDRAELINSLQKKAGLISSSEVSEAGNRLAVREKQDEKQEELATESTLTVKTNSEYLTGGKGANRYSFAPDQAICIQDALGKDGQLYRAKDMLKADFGAKYYNGKIPGKELMGSWWLVSATHDVQEVISAIKSH